MSGQTPKTPLTGTAGSFAGQRSISERRTFFQWLTYGLSAVALAAAGIPLIGYFVGVRKRKKSLGSTWARWIGFRSTKLG